MSNFYTNNKLDLSLIHNVQMLASGDIAHQLNNTLQIYKTNIEFLNKIKGKKYVITTGKRNKIKEDIENARCKLNSFVLSKRIEKYHNYEVC